jgi:hypothetical protein
MPGAGVGKKLNGPVHALFVYRFPDLMAEKYNAVALPIPFDAPVIEIFISTL